MSKENKTDPAEELLQLQQGFKRNLPDRISAIQAEWQSLRDKSSPDYLELHLKIHSLVGAAGTFGASLVSTTAIKCENYLKSWMKDSSVLNNDTLEQIDSLMLQLSEQACKWQPSSIPYIPDKAKVQNNSDTNWCPNIFLVEDDVEVANILMQFLEKAGYKVFYYGKLKEFKDAYLQGEAASAIIMDISFNEGVIAGAETIQFLSEMDNNFPAVVFISVHDDLQARLAAAKAGASRYFTKPIDKQKLVNSLDKLTHRLKDDAYRVLLMDDDKDVLDYYSSKLEECGINVLSFTNPLEGYHAIEKFRPELIILDLYMPECSGFDLAKVIRQNDDQASIPIVFLSSEMDTGTQLAALDLGGDDFLMKPVEIEYFMQAITTRVRRSRYISNLNDTVKDTLRESEYRLVALDQHAIISMADTSGTITFVNDQFVTISGYREDELLGSNHRLLKSGRHDLDFYKNIWGTITSGNIWSGQICNKRKNGNEYWVEATIVPFLDEAGAPYKYVSVRTDITKTKQSEVALFEAKKEADKANLAKSHFLSNMSHELRTPLNAISGFAQLIKLDSNKNNEDIKNNDYAEEILKASDHLLDLINELLDLAKVESGKIDLHMESVNVTDLILESISLVNTTIEERNISLSYQFNGNDVSLDEFLKAKVHLNIDRIRLKQLLINLLSNAVKYNSEQGSILVACDASTNLIRFSITDTGKGISDHHQKDLFKSFYRLDEELGNIEGSGIGLVITKNLVELMHGSIGVESKLGVGSTFWVEFPVITNKSIK